MQGRWRVMPKPPAGAAAMRTGANALKVGAGGARVQ